MPQQHPLTILGAGIGGLTLGQCLRKKGISSVLYEKVPASTQRHSYGITLHPSSYKALSDLLDVDTEAFRRQTAVDRLYQDGLGNFQSETQQSSSSDPPRSFRANRAKLEQLLREGLNIKYGQSIETATRLSTLTGPSSLIVDALGVHSLVRLSLLPNSTPTVLPYVVFNGRRSISLAQYEKHYAHYFHTADSTRVVLHPADDIHRRGVRLEVSLNDFRSPARALPGSPSPAEVDISYTYSRPAFAKSPDPLHNPTRSNASASTIPEEFYTELNHLHASPGGESTSASFFDPELVRDDRVLHWLMRTLLLSRNDLSALADNRIVVIGDSAHATPILGGSGANSAIRDAFELAFLIGTSTDGPIISPLQGDSGGGVSSDTAIPVPAGDGGGGGGGSGTADDDTTPRWKAVIERFYDQCHARWGREVEESKRAIADMHGERSAEDST